MNALSTQAGAPGTGKTTFIQNLASAYGHDDCSAAGGPSSPGQAHQPAEDLVESFSTDPTALDEFKYEAETLCTRVLWSDDTAKINYTLLIQVGGPSALVVHAPAQGGQAPSTCSILSM